MTRRFPGPGPAPFLRVTLGRDLPSRPALGLPRRTVYTGPRPATFRLPVPGQSPPGGRRPAHPGRALTGAAPRHPPPCPARTAAGGSGSCRVGARVRRRAPRGVLRRRGAGSRLHPRGEGQALLCPELPERGGALWAGLQGAGLPGAGPMRMGPGAAAASNGRFRSRGRGRVLGAGHGGEPAHCSMTSRSRYCHRAAVPQEAELGSCCFRRAPRCRS